MNNILKSFILCLTLLLLVACSPQESAQSETNQEPAQTIEEATEDKLIVGTIIYDPFRFEKDGMITGPQIDIIRQALDRLDYDYEIVVYPWSRLVESIRTGEVDITFAFFDTPERRQYLNFTEEPLHASEFKIYVPADSQLTYQGNFNILREHRVGIIQDFFYSTEFNRALDENQLNVDMAFNSETNIDKLLMGRVDLIIENSLIVEQHLINTNTVGQIKALDPPINATYTYFVFPKIEDHDELRINLDRELRAMKEDGSFYDAYTPYNLEAFAQLLKNIEAQLPIPDRHFQSYHDPKISVGVLGNTKPYAYYENGVLTGFGVDFISEVLTRIGLDYELRDLPFSRMLEELKAGSLDIATDVYLTPERQTYAHYPELPYAGYPTVLFKRKNMELEFDGNIDDLTQFTIGYVRDYSIGPFDDYKDSDIFKFTLADSPKENIESLMNDRVELIIDIKSTGESFIDQLNLSENIEAIDPPLFYNYSYVAFSKKNNLDKLVKEYDAVVLSMFEDGTIEMLSEKYNLPYLEFEEFRK